MQQKKTFKNKLTCKTGKWIFEIDKAINKYFSSIIQNHSPLFAVILSSKCRKVDPIPCLVQPVPHGSDKFRISSNWTFEHLNVRMLCPYSTPLFPKLKFFIE